MLDGCFISSLARILKHLSDLFTAHLSIPIITQNRWLGNYFLAFCCATSLQVAWLSEMAEKVTSDYRLRWSLSVNTPMHARSLAGKLGRKHIDLLDVRWLCEKLGSFLHECRGDATGKMSLSA